MLTIGKLSKATGVKVPTIRYYEQIGLLPEAARSQGNQRLYGAAAERRLTFIRHARDLGFPLDAIRDLLNLPGGSESPCAAAASIAREQLATIEARMAWLTTLKAELERTIAQCSGGCESECRIVEALADHSLCTTDHRQDRPDMVF